MKKTYLIADSGATKCHWTLVENGKRQTIKTTGISPYFLGLEAIVQLLEKTFQKKTDLSKVDAVYFYGTGLSNPDNVTILKKALKAVFKNVSVILNFDKVCILSLIYVYILFICTYFLINISLYSSEDSALS